MATPFFTPTPKQEAFLTALLSNEYRFLLFGGAIRGGKSYVAIAAAIILAQLFPKSRWAIVRKDLPTLRRTTLVTYQRMAPKSFCGPLNQSTWTVNCANGSQIIFFPATEKEDPELNRWRGLEVNGFILEEVNEIRETTFNKAIERAGSWKVPDGGVQPPPWIIATCNPSKGWVKRVWYDPWRAGVLAKPWFYLPSKITDNPHLDPAYVDSLENLPEAEYRTFVEGDWESADEPDQLIKYQWVAEAFARVPILGRPRLGVDVARFGDDDTCLARVEGRHLAELRAHHGIDTAQTAGLVLLQVNDHKISAGDIVVDTVGVGSGVADILFRQNKLKVTEFIAGAKPIGTDKFFTFKNLRSEAWWRIRELLRLGLCSFSPDIPETDRNRLTEDLTAPKYTVTGERMLAVESKDEIKKRLGRSTDYADAVVQAYAEISAAGWLNKINTK